MPNENSEKQKLSFKEYIQAAISFAATRLALLSFRQPIHIIKTNKQAKPEVSSWTFIKNTLLEEGLKGFYKSTWTSVNKILLIESYRGPLLLAAPGYIEQFFPILTKDYPWSKNVFSIGAISLIDATIICPVLRISAHQVTDCNKNIRARDIFKHYTRTGLLNELYRGYRPLLFQTTVLWGSFLTFDDLTKQLTEKYFGKEKSNTTLVSTSLAAGFIYSGIKTALNIIPDTVRTHMQQANRTNLGAFATLRDLHIKCGIKGLFAGATLKYINGALGFAYKSILREVFTEPKSSNVNGEPRFVLDIEKAFEQERPVIHDNQQQTLNDNLIRKYKINVEKSIEQQQPVIYWKNLIRTNKEQVIKKENER
jgi:hypothetical protein